MGTCIITHLANSFQKKGHSYILFFLKQIGRASDGIYGCCSHLFLQLLSNLAFFFYPHYTDARTTQSNVPAEVTP